MLSFCSEQYPQGWETLSLGLSSPCPDPSSDPLASPALSSCLGPAPSCTAAASITPLRWPTVLAYLGLRSFRGLRDPTSLLPLPGVMLTPFPAPSHCMCERPPSLSLPPLLNSLPCFSPRPWEAPFLKRNRVRNSPDINSHLSLIVVQSHASYTISSSPSLCEGDCCGGHPIDTRRYGGLGGPLPSQGHTAGDLWNWIWNPSMSCMAVHVYLLTCACCLLLGRNLRATAKAALNQDARTTAAVPQHFLFISI